MKLQFVFFSVTALTLFFPRLLPATRAWDSTGHLLIGEISWSQTSEAARARVGDLVSQLPNEYNHGRAYQFVTASCWMDDMRAMANYPWAAWHYVRAPWTSDGLGFALPEPPHVVWAIDSSLQHLQDPSTSSAKRAEAAAMLIHFIEDIHQPLHATDRSDDHCGNGFLISNFEPIGPGSGKPVTLHFFWDAAYRFAANGAGFSETWRGPSVSSRPTMPGEGVIAGEAAKITAEFPPDSFPELRDPEKRTATSWARESYQTGCRSGYPQGQAPSDTELHALPMEFVTNAHEIATRRVALAGYRLARVLNELFGG